MAHDGRLPQGEIERQSADDDGRRNLGTRPSQAGANAREELLLLEGLNQIVVRAGVEAGNPLISAHRARSARSRGRRSEFLEASAEATSRRRREGGGREG